MNIVVWWPTLALSGSMAVSMSVRCFISFSDFGPLLDFAKSTFSRSLKWSSFRDGRIPTNRNPAIRLHVFELVVHVLTSARLYMYMYMHLCIKVT